MLRAAAFPALAPLSSKYLSISIILIFIIHLQYFFLNHYKIINIYLQISPFSQCCSTINQQRRPSSHNVWFVSSTPFSSRVCSPWTPNAPRSCRRWPNSLICTLMNRWLQKYIVYFLVLTKLKFVKILKNLKCFFFFFQGCCLYSCFNENCSSKCKFSSNCVCF